MRDDAEFLRSIIRQYHLDIVDLQDLQGLVGRHPWLSLGRVPEGRYDLVQRIPPKDRVVPQVNTLIVTSPCAKRANRIKLLALLTAELPRFVRSNPPSSTSSATKVSLSSEARQFFLTGEPEFADRYFPWLVNIVARLLGVSRHGSDRDLQRAQGAKSFLALAHRCCAGEDRGRGQTGGGPCREPWVDASFFNQ